MSTLAVFANRIRDAGHDADDRTLSKAGLHIFDTLGALIVGRELPDTRALAKATDGPMAMARGSVWSEIVLSSAAIRATEIDDIHLRGCVTPSSVVVPVTLLMARHLAITDGGKVLQSAIAGYEALVRFGCAADGPSLLGKGIWPTPLCAAVGAAASTASLLDLSAKQFQNALALAASVSIGMNLRGDAPTARWTPVALASANGAFMALAAAGGLQADETTLDGRWSAASGVSLNTDILCKAPDGRSAIEDISLKPWCGARQTMAAGAAFRAVLHDDKVQPDAIDQITIEVPSAYRGMIDRLVLAEERQETFADLRYTLAQLAFAPDALYDVRRERVVITEPMRALARKVSIVAAPDLSGLYPDRWGSRVTVVTGDGKRLVREMLEVPGDPANPLSTGDVISKFATCSGRPEAAARSLHAQCRALSDDGGIAPVMDAVGW